jgi:PST family polysaccharide transporter
MEPNDVDTVDSDLAQVNSKRGVAFAFPTQVCRVIVHFASICVLGRLLTPNDYGIAGMVFTMAGFLELFKDGGLGLALVQAKHLSSEVVATLFWIVLLISVCLGGVMLNSGVFLAAIYREPRVAEVTWFFSIAIVANGLSVIPQSLLLREHRFGRLALVEIVASTSGVSVAIIVALNGGRYYALAFQPLAASLTLLSLCWIYSPIWPGRPRWTVEVRKALHYGVNLSAFGFVNYFARNLDNVLIGRYWGASVLGTYARAYTLLLAPISFINNPLASVYIPVLSRLQSNPELLRIHFLRGLSLATSISLPIAATSLVCSEEIVRILLGHEWLEVADIFRLLCISAPFQFCGNPFGWLFQSLGRTDRQFRWGIFASTIIVGSFFVGLPWGARGVALSYSCVMIPITCLNIWYATRETRITMFDVIGYCFPTILFSTILGALLLGCKFAIRQIAQSYLIDCLLLGIGVIGISVSLAMRAVRVSRLEKMHSPIRNISDEPPPI